ncbi:MAG: glycosyltransferase [Saprospiraceae bacterium]|nr:glycosyltransferase [Saprospiraceae bacterium]
MRIAIVTAWYPNKNNPLYGIFIQNQVHALAEHCSVCVLLLKWSLVPYQRKRKEGNVTIIEKGDFYFPNASETMLNFWASRYVRFFKSIHEEFAFDLIHAHDHYGAFVSDKLKNELSIPYVCTIHNSTIMNDSLVEWKKAYLPRILTNADSVISVGQKLAQTLNKKYHITGVKVIPNYIDTDVFSLKPTKAEEDFKFLFVGGLEAHKGVFELVKAFHLSRFSETSLHIVGTGILEKEIKAYVLKNNLENSVILHGEILNHKLSKIYNASNVYVSVSEYETFGVTILEAMACGLPVLYSDSGGPNDFVQPFVGIKLHDRSIETISNGLIEIQARYSSFDSRKIRDFVVENYGSDKVIGRLLKEYKEVLDAKN